MSEELNEMIRAELDKRGLSERAASERAGLSAGTLNYILSDPEHTPAKETVKKLARFFNWNELRVLEAAGYTAQLGIPAPPPNPIELLERAKAEMPVPIPRVEQLLHASSGAVPMDYIYLPAAQAKGRRLVAAPVRGNCMEPTIMDGEELIIDLDGSPSEGDIVVALIDRDDVQVKRLARKLNSHLVLSCDNPAYSEIEVEDVQIQGVVIRSSKVFKG